MTYNGVYREVQWMANEGTTGHRLYRDDCTGSSGSLQMVDHTLIDVPLAKIYLDSLYYL